MFAWGMSPLVDEFPETTAAPLHEKGVPVIDYEFLLRNISQETARTSSALSTLIVQSRN
jgi:hypothetical protein